MQELLVGWNTLQGIRPFWKEAPSHAMWTTDDDIIRDLRNNNNTHTHNPKGEYIVCDDT